MKVLKSLLLLTLNTSQQGDDLTIQFLSLENSCRIYLKILADLNIYDLKYQGIRYFENKLCHCEKCSSE